MRQLCCFIAKWNRSLLENASGFYYKMRWFYYKMRQLLQSAMFAKNCDSTVNKTELVIFRWRKIKVDHSFKFKLDVKRLLLTKSVKHLGLLLDENLHLNEQISQVKVKLNRAVGILSKLRHNVNLDALKIISQSLFNSHILCGCEV